MKVNINSVHFKADKKLSTFISDKVEKLSQMYDGVIGSDVTLKVENSDTPNSKIAEIRLIIRGNDLFAKKHSKTFEEATDVAVEALRRQLTRYKDKIRNR